MKVRVFTLQWDEEARTFDDTPLARFFEGRTGLEVTEHFLVHERAPVLVLVVRYRDEAAEAPRRADGGRSGPCAGGPPIRRRT